MASILAHDSKRNGATAVLGLQGLGFLMLVDSFADDFGCFWATTNAEKEGALNKALPKMAHDTILDYRKLLADHGVIEHIPAATVKQMYKGKAHKPHGGVWVWHITGILNRCGDEECVCQTAITEPVEIFYSGAGDDGRKSLPKLVEKVYSEDEESVEKVYPKGVGKEEGNPKRKKKGAKKPPDPRKDHPAIVAFRDHHKRFPQHGKASTNGIEDWWDVIIEAVGSDEKKLEFWKKAMVKWNGVSKNVFNISGQLEMFAEIAGKGADTRTRGNPNGRPASSISPEQMRDAIRAAEERKAKNAEKEE